MNKSFDILQEKMIDSTTQLASGATATYGPYAINRSSKFGISYSIPSGVPNIAVNYLLGRTAGGTFSKPSQSNTPNIFTISAVADSNFVAFDIDEPATFLKIQLVNNGNTVNIAWMDFNHQ